MLLWGVKDRERQPTLVIRCNKDSNLCPFVYAPCLGVFDCIWTPHKLCWEWLQCIHRFCQYLCGDLTVLAKFSGQDRAEETPLQSSGFKIRPVSPIVLYCLGSLSQLCLISHQPEMLQHTASHKQERERRWTSHQAPGQGKDISQWCSFFHVQWKELPRVGQRAYALLSRAVPRAKHSWRKNQKPSNPVSLEGKQSEQC